MSVKIHSNEWEQRGLLQQGSSSFARRPPVGLTIPDFNSQKFGRPLWIKFFPNLFPRGMMAVATVWGLVEVVIAGVAGAWIYTEA